MLKIGVVGAAGRMGRMNIAEVLNCENAILSAALERAESEFLNQDVGFLAIQKNCGVIITSDVDKFINESDAVIDFSSPSSTLAIAEKISKAEKIHVIGTTGIEKADEEKLSILAKNCKIIYAPNMSLGVNLLFAIVKKIASTLDETYDIEILEMHHNKKVDSPSGTALGLGKAVAEGRGVKLEDVWCKARDGQIGARKKGEVGFATLRGGDVVGDHTVIFATEGERLEVAHKASNRNVFAKGALKAALWAKNQKNGFYNMLDVLGF